MNSLAFALACVVLMLIPGPNVALIVASSVAQGRRHGLLTVLGTCTAMAAQLALAAAGLAGLLAIAAHGLAWLRWLGAAYLVMLGLAKFRAQPPSAATSPATPRRTVLRAFLLGMANPKTMLFYAAILPQFVTHAHPLPPQLAELAAIALGAAAVIDSGWALAAARARHLIDRRSGDRLSGTLLIGAGAGLAIARPG